MRRVLLSLTFFFVLFSQVNYYYNIDGSTVQLTQKPRQFLVSVDNNFHISHLGNCKIDTIKQNLYIVDDTSFIVSRVGIKYITSGLELNPYTPLFVGKEISFLFKESYSQTVKDSIYNLYKLKLIKKTPNYELASIPNDQSAFAIANSLFETGMFIHAAPDFFVKAFTTEHIPNDTYFSQQWYLHNTGQGTNDGKSTTPDADIDAPEAWDITQGSPGIVIAVLDHGVSSNHPDLPDTRQVRLNGSNFAYQ